MFQTIDELPPSIRENLPRLAQELYRAAYNRAWEQLAAGEQEDLVNIAVESHKAARLAVEYEFTQDNKGRWHRDPVGDEMKHYLETDEEPDPD